VVGYSYTDFENFHSKVIFCWKLQSFTYLPIFISTMLENLKLFMRAMAGNKLPNKLISNTM